MDLHVAITGATGFIGAAVVAELLTRGARVTVLLRAGSDPARLARLENKESLTYAKLTDPGLVGRLRALAPAAFLHCAWQGVAGADRNQAVQITGNLPLTLDSVELASNAGCQSWLGLGSQAEYGNPNCKISETASLQPTTIYGKAKLASGIAALGLCEARGLRGAWLRVFSTYGPGDAPGWLIPYLIREFLAGKAPQLTRCEQRWDYLFIEDAARAIVEVIVQQKVGVYNLGSGYAEPLRSVVEELRKQLAIQAAPAYGAVEYRPDQVMHLEADITRLSQATGWHPIVPLSTGLRATLAAARPRIESAELAPISSL